MSKFTPEQQTQSDLYLYLSRPDPLGLRTPDGNPKQIMETAERYEDYRRDGTLKRRGEKYTRITNY